MYIRKEIRRTVSAALAAAMVVGSSVNTAASPVFQGGGWKQK